MARDIPVLGKDSVIAFVRASNEWTLEDGVLVHRRTKADFAEALEYVNAVAAIAERRDHHPDIELRWNKVTLRLSTHDVGGVTSLDLDLAREIEDALRAGLVM